jgi:hypothetical protein
MTSNKAMKRAVRARMARTGERYAAARHHLVSATLDATLDAAAVGAVAVTGSTRIESATAATAVDPHSADPAANDAPSPFATPVVDRAATDVSPRRLPPRVAEPGMGDDAIARGTGRTWDEWFGLLDAWGANERTHAEIARHVVDAYGVDGWWAQGVAVGYERARGLRARHQRPDGFSANLSKTLPVPAEAIHAALVDEAARDRWLEPGTLRLRTSQPGRSARFDVPADGTRLHVYVVSKGPGKAAVQIQIERLPDAAAVTERKAWWRERLARLATFLTQAAATPAAAPLS